MKITNHLNLPEPVVAAVTNDPYSRGESKYSVTQLCSSPRVSALLAMHEHEIEVDAADRIYSLLGQSVHTILERSGHIGIREQRLFMRVNGIMISGQFDYLVYEDGVLSDYKVMSVWEYIYGLNKEKHWQLNMLAELAEQNGYHIHAIEIVAIFRDWSKRKASFERTYPKKQVLRMPIALRGHTARMDLIENRVQLHEAAREVLPLCSDDERWAQPTMYALMKKGRVSALRVMDSEEKLNRWAVENGHATPSAYNKDVYLEVRHGVSTKCEHYCDVAQFCRALMEKDGLNWPDGLEK